MRQSHDSGERLFAVHKLWGVALRLTGSKPAEVPMETVSAKLTQEKMSVEGELKGV